MGTSDKRWRHRELRRNKDKIDPSLPPEVKRDLRRFRLWENFRQMGLLQRFETLMIVILVVLGLGVGFYMKLSVLWRMVEREAEHIDYAG